MKIAIVRFADSESAIRQVRDAVFGEEQQVPRALDYDGSDPECLHVLACDEQDRPVGTGRLLPDGRIGRLAVLRSWRGRGFGRQLLEALVQAARQRAYPRVYLHAQVQAAAFYEKQGFCRDGEEFLEAGIRHVNMTR